jgi:hypothetical protein
MNTYDPHTTLDAISHHAAAVIAVGGLSIVAMFVFFIEGALMGRRDRVYPMALWMTALWWPHDGSYLLHFHDWFGGAQNHWFMQLFWFAIVVTFLAESVYAWQTIKYGREELSPGCSPCAHSVRILGAMTAGVISWAVVKGALDDNLYLLSFMATLLWGGPSGSAMLGRRRHRRGQSLLEWIAYSTMAVLYSVTSIFYFGGGFFHSWQYVGICVASCVWSLALIADAKRAGVPFSWWKVRRLPVDTGPADWPIPPKSSQAPAA